MRIQYAGARLRTYLIFHQNLDNIQPFDENYSEVKDQYCQVCIKKLSNYNVTKHILIAFTALTK